MFIEIREELKIAAVLVFLLILAFGTVAKTKNDSQFVRDNHNAALDIHRIADNMERLVK